MIIMNKFLQQLLVLFFPLFLIGQSTVVDVVVDSPDHTLLETAVLAADLAGTLSGPGPFTLFAPTDAAFATLPDGTLDAVLADNDLLTSILLYHALAADVRSTDLMDGMTATTINGKDITVTIDNGVFINGAQVTVADIVTDNGVVHVIDAVLLPPTVTVVDVVVNSPDHNTLEAAVIAADLAGTLSGDGPFTLFAPTDAAFAALPDGLVDALLQDAQGDLTTVLLYHALSGTVLSSDLSDGQAASTLQGEDVTVSINTEGVFINNAQVTVADIVTDNGVVHVIDAVLVPSILSDVDEAALSSIKLFPNPVSDYLQYDFSGLEEDVKQLSILTRTGQVIRREILNTNQSRMNVRDINGGVYIIEIQTEKNTYYKQVIINR